MQNMPFNNTMQLKYLKIYFDELYLKPLIMVSNMSTYYFILFVICFLILIVIFIYYFYKYNYYSLIFLNSYL